jgi:hypothetical protein
MNLSILLDHRKSETLLARDIIMEQFEADLIQKGIKNDLPSKSLAIAISTV